MALALRYLVRVKTGGALLAVLVPMACAIGMRLLGAK